MDDEFALPAEYKGHRYLFKPTLLVFGFTHKFRVDVNGQVILFEPDEERNYRQLLTIQITKKLKILMLLY